MWQGNANKLSDGSLGSTASILLPLLIADDFPPQIGGIQRYMRSLADAFHALGSPVTVIAPDAEGASVYDQALPYEVIRIGGTSRAEKVSRFAIACASMGRRTAAYSLASLWFPSGLAASILPRKVRGPLGILVHGTEVCKPRGIRRAIMRSVFSRADAVIANSHFTRSLVLQSGVSRTVDVSSCGVDDFALEVPRSDTPLILSVGRLVRRKGFDRLLQAMPAILRVRADVICEIVGSGPERDRLERLANILGIASSVRFLGPIDDLALRRAYARAWCFALPARRCGDDVEGFGIVYLEAAVAAIPAIGGSNSGAVDAIVDGETGYLVDGANADEIANALLRVLLDRDLAHEMGDRARQRSLSQFTWRSCALRIDSIMSTALL